MKTILDKMTLNITMAKITMLKEDIRFHKEMLDEKRERLVELEAKFRKLQNTKA